MLILGLSAFYATHSVASPPRNLNLSKGAESWVPVKKKDRRDKKVFNIVVILHYGIMHVTYNPFIISQKEVYTITSMYLHN